MPGIVAGALLILLAYLTAWFPALGRVGPWLMVGGIVTLLLGLLYLGMRRGRRFSPALVLGLVVLGLILLGGFGAALLLPAEAAGSRLLLGLPRRAALLVYGVGLLPVLGLPLFYAWSFERTVLDADELARHRARLAEPEAGT